MARNNSDSDTAFLCEHLQAARDANTRGDSVQAAHILIQAMSEGGGTVEQNLRAAAQIKLS